MIEATMTQKEKEIATKLAKIRRERRKKEGDAIRQAIANWGKKTGYGNQRVSQR